MNRIKVSKKDYQSLFVQKRILASKFYVFFIKKFDHMVCKVTVKKKVGNAVVRNYYKRRLRAVLGAILSELNFKENHLVLGVIVKKHRMDFESEKRHVVKVLQSLIS